MENSISEKKEDKKPISLSNLKKQEEPIFKNSLTGDPIIGLTQEKYEELLSQKHPLANVELI